MKRFNSSAPSHSLHSRLGRCSSWSVHPLTAREPERNLLQEGGKFNLQMTINSYCKKNSTKHAHIVMLMKFIYCNNTEHATLIALSILMNVNAVFLHLTLLYLQIYCRQSHRIQKCAITVENWVVWFIPPLQCGPRSNFRDTQQEHTKFNE